MSLPISGAEKQGKQDLVAGVEVDQLSADVVSRGLR